MFALTEFLDGCTFLWKERQREVAGVVHRSRWKVDLFPGLRLFAANLKFVETRGWDLDTIDDECTFVAVDEVDSDLGLTKNFLVVRRRHVLDLVGKVQCVASGGGGVQAEDDENQTHGHPKAGEKCRLVEFFPCFHGLILTRCSGKCPSGD